MYEWLEQYQLQHYSVKARQKCRCDFVQICSYVKPFASFNRLDCDCTPLVEDKLFDILAIDDKDKDDFARAILETLQKEPPIEVARVANSTRLKIFSPEEVSNIVEEINKMIEP